MSRRTLSHRFAIPAALVLLGLSLAVAQPAMGQAPGVTENSFTAEVIEASRQKPVFVNLYAVWCGPCRPLFPVLDTVADEYSGRAKLVSVDVDENPRTVNAMLELLDEEEIKRPPNMQIPAVIAFRDGKPTGLMIGGQTKIEAVREFFAKNDGS